MKKFNSAGRYNDQIIALVNCDNAVTALLSICNFENRQLINFKNAHELYSAYEKQSLNIAGIISQGEPAQPFGIELLENLVKMNFPKVPFFLISKELDANIVKLALRAGVCDVFTLPVNVIDIQKRINFIVECWPELCKNRRSPDHSNYRIPNETRLFDLGFSALLLILFSPLILLISILIKITSKGPVFTHSLRVGANYHIFKMFNFRILKLKGAIGVIPINSETNPALTHYSVENGLCEECRDTRVKCKFPIFADNVTWCEKKFMYTEKLSAENSAKGVMPDIGLTTIGLFLKRTRLHQLPEFFNVLKGDMSIVGNIPLPLSEAEKLTTDKYVLRFMAPAGITGLWQIEKRKKTYNNQPGRLVLDIRYARNQHFQSDMILLAKSIPSLLK